jgi:hypothetical protein
LRVYDILGQDDAGTWMVSTFPNLFYIRFTSIYNWAPSDTWVDTNVQNKGPLGAVYPNRTGATEGDSPSFFYQYPNGLSDPEHVDWGCWGGRCGLTKNNNMYTDAPEGGSSIGRWSTAIDNDFSARMDWSITSSYAAANHHPIAVLNGDTTKAVLQISASAGSTVNLSAAGSSDPDGNGLVYSWFFYDKPSSYVGTVTIQNSSSPEAAVVIPAAASGKTIHVILQINDNGTPNLYAYRRVVISVN